MNSVATHRNGTRCILALVAMLPAVAGAQAAMPGGGQVAAKAALGRPPSGQADVPALFAIGDRAIAVYKTFLLFTTKPGQLPDTAANQRLFEDETVRAAGFAMRAQAATLRGLDDSGHSLPADKPTPVRLAGLKQANVGGSQFLSMSVGELRKVENRAALVDALADAAVLAAPEITRFDRETRLRQIDAAVPGVSGPDAVTLAKAREAFARPDRAALCALQRRLVP